MDHVPKKRKIAKNMTQEELLFLTKDELAERIIQLETHNSNLRNIISKSVSDDSNTENRNKQKKEFDFSKCHFRHVLLHVLYFGWEYQGFVVQEDTAQTIEHCLFHALTKTCFIQSRELSQYQRCGRTDKGVSSYGQVISIRIRSKHSPELQNQPLAIAEEFPYCKTLNRVLPKDIRVVAWMPIPENKPDFSARFDCNKRQYKYFFPRGSLDVGAMRHACKLFLGNHDFRNFCKMDVGNGVTEFRRTILKADIVAVDENDVEKPTSMYYFLIEGNAFLWHQIRCKMAILLLIGSGKETQDIITQLLDVDTYPKKPQYNMAVDLPLNLFHCNYDVKSDWIYNKEDLANVISHLQCEWTIENVKTTMIKHCIQDLEAKYKEAKTRIEDGDEASERDNIINYTNCLTTGIKPKAYVPLLKRPTCSSLEERIEHYKKRRNAPKLEKMD